MDNNLTAPSAISPAIAALILEALETILARGGYGEITLIVERGKAKRVTCTTSIQPKEAD